MQFKAEKWGHNFVLCRSHDWAAWDTALTDDVSHEGSGLLSSGLISHGLFMQSQINRKSLECFCTFNSQNYVSSWYFLFSTSKEPEILLILKGGSKPQRLSVSLFCWL